MPDTLSARAAVEACAAFALPGRVLRAETLGHGLINDTWLVVTDAVTRPRAVLQHINRRAFPEPARIMHNLGVLLDHAARHPGAGLRLPGVIPTRNGGDFFEDEQGGFWRMLEYIQDSYAVMRVEDARLARELGAALGRFHALTADLDPARLQVARAGFHDTPRYLARLHEAIQGAGAAVGDEGVSECLGYIATRESRAGVLQQARARGELAPRIVHGDPKIDNVLFDTGSGRAIAMVDLDTVQPGLLLHDLGDCLRSACNAAGESPDDPHAARFDLDLCRALLEGYAAQAAGGLTPGDRGLLPDAAWVIALELGVRFLTDHLNGDAYFKVGYRGQNLQRARVQLRLAADIGAQTDALRQLVGEVLSAAV